MERRTSTQAVLNNTLRSGHRCEKGEGKENTVKAISAQRKCSEIWRCDQYLNRSSCQIALIRLLGFLAVVARVVGVDIFGVSLFSNIVSDDYLLTSGFAQGVYFPSPINKFVFSDGIDTSRVFSMQGIFESVAKSATQESYLRSIAVQSDQLLQLRNGKTSKSSVQILGTLGVLSESSFSIISSNNYSSWALDVSVDSSGMVYFSPFVNTPKVHRIDTILSTICSSTMTLLNKAIFLHDIGAGRLAIGGLFNNLEIWDKTTLSGLFIVNLANSLEIGKFQPSIDRLYAVEPKTSVFSRALLVFSTTGGITLINSITPLQCVTSAVTSLLIASTTPEIVFYTCANSDTLHAYDIQNANLTTLSILQSAVRSSADMYRLVQGPTVASTEIYFMYPWQQSLSSTSNYLGFKFASISQFTCIDIFGSGKRCRACDTGRYLYFSQGENACVIPEELLYTSLGVDLHSKQVRHCNDSNCYNCNQNYLVCDICIAGTFFDENMICKVPRVSGISKFYDPKTGRFSISFNKTILNQQKLNLVSFSLRDDKGTLQLSAVTEVVIDTTSNSITGKLAKLNNQAAWVLVLGNCEYLFNGLQVSNTSILISPSVEDTSQAMSENNWSSTSTSKAVLGVAVGSTVAEGVLTVGVAGLGLSGSSFAKGGSSGLASFVKLFSNIDYLLLVDITPIRRSENFLNIFRGQVLDFLPNPLNIDESVLDCTMATSFRRKGVSCSILNNFGSEYIALAGIAVLSVFFYWFWKRINKRGEKEDSSQLAKKTPLNKKVNLVELVISLLFSLESLVALIEGCSMEGVRWSVVNLIFPSSSISNHMQIAKVLSILTIVFYICIGFMMLTFLKSARRLATENLPSSLATFNCFSFITQHYKRDVTTHLAYLTPLLLYAKNITTQLILVVFAAQRLQQICTLLVLEIVGVMITAYQIKLQLGWARFSRFGQQFLITTLMLTYLVISLIDFSQDTLENVASYVICSQFMAFILLGVSVQGYELSVVFRESLRHMRSKKRLQQAVKPEVSKVKSACLVPTLNPFTIQTPTQTLTPRPVDLGLLTDRSVQSLSPIKKPSNINPPPSKTIAKQLEAKAFFRMTSVNKNDDVSSRKSASIKSKMIITTTNNSCIMTVSMSKKPKNSRNFEVRSQEQGTNDDCLSNDQPSQEQKPINPQAAAPSQKKVPCNSD
jgi:hypothetical protein